MSAIEEQVRRLREGSPAERREAAISLGRLGGGGAIEALIGALSDATIHSHAMNALQTLGPERVGPRATALLDHPDPVRRVCAAEALAAPHLRVRLYAAESLLHLGNPVERHRVLALLASPERDSRWLAAKVIAGGRGSARRDVAAEACPPLFALLRSDRPEDGYLALLTFRRIVSDVPAALRDRLRALVEALRADPDSRDGRLAAEILRALDAIPSTGETP